jgi:uncharacterized phage protein gp47/JayE
MAVKDKPYHLAKLQANIKARIPKLVFRLWDPLTAFADATAGRAAEISADVLQIANNFYIDSAAGAQLDRRLSANEQVPRLQALPANDGTVTLGRLVAPAVSTTFPIGSITVAPPPDPSKPTTNRPTYTNTVALTIGPGFTSWTLAFAATRGGADTNLPAGTTLQLVSQTTLLDTAVVGAAFTTGTDAEADAAYRQRGKLVIRSRARGTDDALVAAALTAGASFAYTVENFTGGAIPVTLYAADANGALSTPLRAAIVRQVNGDQTVSPVLPMARAKGILVDVQPAATVTFNFSIGLVLQTFVVDNAALGIFTLTNLKTDINTAVTNYIKALNTPGNTDRVMRLNGVKAIVKGFKSRGVLDVVDATFLPASSTALTASQIALMGSITWL